MNRNQFNASKQKQKKHSMVPTSYLLYPIYNSSLSAIKGVGRCLLVADRAGDNMHFVLAKAVITYAVCGLRLAVRTHQWSWQRTEDGGHVTIVPDCARVVVPATIFCHFRCSNSTFQYLCNPFSAITIGSYFIIIILILVRIISFVQKHQFSTVPSFLFSLCLSFFFVYVSSLAFFFICFYLPSWPLHPLLSFSHYVFVTMSFPVLYSSLYHLRTSPT